MINSTNDQLSSPLMLRTHFARRLSRVVRGLYALTGALGISALVSSSDRAGAGAAAVKLALPILILAFATFLVWLRTVRDLLPALGRPDPGFTSSDLVTAFFVPFVALVRPYRMIRALDRALDSHDLPLPPVATERDRERGYRDPIVARDAFPDAASLRLWWATWVFSPAIAFAAGPVAGRFVPKLPAARSACGSLVTERSRDLAMVIAYGMNITEAALLVALTVTSFATLLIVGQMQARLTERGLRIRARAQG